MLDRRAVLTGLAAAPLAGCATLGAGGGRTLKLATFNIWHNQGDWATRQPLLIEALRSSDADVIALQEVLEDAAVGLPNQARTLADALNRYELGGYETHFASVDAEGAPRRYGNALLSRLPVLQHDWKKLEPLEDYRSAVRLRVSVDGRPVDVVGTHLAWQDDAQAVRARQLADLTAWLPHDGTPLIVMGDFNAVQEDAGLNALTDARFFSALPRGTVPTTLNPAKGHPNRVIDHIFAETAHFAPVSHALLGHEPTGGEYASDHFGVAATVRLL